METGHVYTQTSKKDRGSNVTTQTSKRQLPNRSTQTSRGVLPQVGVQTSLVSRPAEVVQEPGSVSQCQSNDNWSQDSTGLLSPAASYSSYTEEKETLRALLYHVIAENEEVDEALIAQSLVLEEETLQEVLQVETKNARERLK